MEELLAMSHQTSIHTHSCFLRGPRGALWMEMVTPFASLPPGKLQCLTGHPADMPQALRENQSLVRIAQKAVLPPQKLMLRSSPPAPQNVPFFGNRVAAVVIS